MNMGSCKQGLSYQELALQNVDYVVEMGLTYVEFLAVAEREGSVPG